MEIEAQHVRDVTSALTLKGVSGEWHVSLCVVYSFLPILPTRICCCVTAFPPHLFLCPPAHCTCSPAPAHCTCLSTAPAPAPTCPLHLYLPTAPAFARDPPVLLPAFLPFLLPPSLILCHRRPIANLRPCTQPSISALTKVFGKESMIRSRKS